MSPVYPPVICATQRRDPARRRSAVASEQRFEHTLRISLLVLHVKFQDEQFSELIYSRFASIKVSFTGRRKPNVA
jgi:hypothetical protein